MTSQSSPSTTPPPPRAASVCGREPRSGRASVKLQSASVGRGRVAAPSRPSSGAARAVEASHAGLSGRLLIALLAGAFVALPLLSWAFGLYERISHWGKLVHGVDGLLVAVTVGLLLL